VSQYSPYTPPDPAAWGYVPGDPVLELLRPARRASWLMFVLGGILLALGACCVGVGALAPWDQLPPESLAQMQQMESQAGVSVSALMIVMGVLSGLPGLVLLVLGFFVRSGGLGSLITALVVTALMLLVLLAMLLNAIVHAASGGAGVVDAAAGIGFVLLILAAFGLLLAWLIQAIRQSGKIAAARQAHQMQYWQAMQQQAYHQIPPPPAPAPPPPPGQPPVG
jgi:hypothetical protein